MPSCRVLAWTIVCVAATACGPSATERDEGEAQPAPAAASGGPTQVVAPAPDVGDEPLDLASADLANGEQQWRWCRQCHLIGGGQHMLGPNLEGVFGRVVGSAPGFPYTGVLREADFVWTPETLDAWLADPTGFLPGNRMVFLGLESPEDRRDLIAWLVAETGASAAPPAE